MRKVNPILALVLCVCQAAPAAAQVRLFSGAIRPGASLPASVPAAPAALTASAPLALPSSLTALPAPAAAAAPSALPSAAPAAQAAASPSAFSPRFGLAAAAEKHCPRSEDLSRPDSERFWSGSDGKTGDDDGAAVEERDRPAEAREDWRSGFYAGAVVAAPAAARDLAVQDSIPYLQTGLKVAAVLGGAYALNRAARWVIDTFLSARLDRQQSAAARLIVNAASYASAAAGALMVSGVSHKVVLGTAGALLTFNLREDLTNVIEAVVFLVARPYSVGTRVQIDDHVGIVSDVTLTSLVVTQDDGSIVSVRHSVLTYKPVVIHGSYTSARLQKADETAPKLRGLLGAAWESLDKRFWLAAGACAALIAAPAVIAPLASGWAATVVHYALAGSSLWLTRRSETALTSIVDRLADRNGWRPESRMIARFAARASAWLAGGGAVLRMLGVSWDDLGFGVETGVGLAAVGVGLATNNLFGSVWESIKTVFSKPFKIGDSIELASLKGEVEDMTLHHVVIKLDEGRHALVPYAAARDAVLVTPGKTNP